MAAITAAIALAGVAIAGAGMIGGAETASQQAGVNKQIAQQQAAIQKQQAMAMELDARRKQLEVFRNAQRARSISLSNATNQGAQFGSGLQGGYGQIGGDANTSLLGINQGLQTGRAISAINQNISGLNGQLSQLSGDASLYSGLTSFGSSLVGNASGISNLTSGWGTSYSAPSVSMGLQPQGSRATGSLY